MERLLQNPTAATDPRLRALQAISRQDDDADSDDGLANVDTSDPLAWFKAMGAGTPGGTPMPTLISPEEARRKAREKSNKIFQHLRHLRAIVDRHEATIQKRWAKKTK